MAAPAMTKESVRALIDGVENDPLAGLGCFTKKDILIDRILAHARVSQPVAQTATPRTVLSEPVANGAEN
ncbi:MAG: hypothetical protein HOP13_19770 [Alphaproteobacteria bacterium]|nr:hypothetical protein [Alphaproteobacteria bacterium]